MRAGSFGVDRGGVTSCRVMQAAIIAPRLRRLLPLGPRNPTREQAAPTEAALWRNNQGRRNTGTLDQVGEASGRGGTATPTGRMDRSASHPVPSLATGGRTRPPRRARCSLAGSAAGGRESVPNCNLPSASASARGLPPSRTSAGSAGRIPWRACNRPRPPWPDAVASEPRANATQTIPIAMHVAWITLAAVKAN